MKHHFVSICTFVLILLSFHPLPAQSGEFSLEQVMSAGFPSEMTPAPVGGGVAWVVNERGVRNIWMARPPDYQGRQLTGYRGDDGQTISQLIWTPDASMIVFVRGDGPNRRGEFPNPLNRPEGTEQVILKLDTGSRKVEKLADGTSPSLDPEGRSLIFLRGDQIWTTPLAGEDEPEQWIHARGRAESLRWSPDGSHLAFVSRRSDHSFVGIYDRESKEVEYISPSVDRDSDPAWSPGGKQIAFLRTPFDRRKLIFGPLREALPWSIQIYDLEHRRARTLWRSDPGPGSAYRRIESSNQLLWSRHGFIVFPWEKDGWTHLYSIPTEGGTPRLLTPGPFEVEEVSLSRDPEWLYFSSNQNDIDRRHLWKVTASGDSPVQVTRGHSNEWSPTPLSSGDALAFIRSTGRSPAQPVVSTSPGSMRLLAREAVDTDFPETLLVNPQKVVFSSADGLEIHGQLFLPGGLTADRKHPAMLFFHGGSRRQMLLGFHYLDYYHKCYAFNQYLANRGFVVLSVNYRSGTGYGMEFREALNYGATGASEFNDVLGAGVYLRGRSDVDPDRIGLWGGSYGGYLTALGLAKASDLFSAGVDLHGVHDWNQVIKNFRPSYDPLERAEVARLAFDSSPMAAISTWRSPVLLIHEDDDRNVPFSETVDLAAALRKQGVDFEQLVFPDEVHGFLTHRAWIRTFQTAAEFLERRLASDPDNN